MIRKLLLLSLLANSVLFVGAAQAHHGTNLYDMTKPVLLKGTITKFEWGNPHNQIFFDVADDKGNIVHWVTSTEPPAVMSEKGWTRRSLNPGDQVMVCVWAAKNGAPVGNLEKVVMSDGKVLNGGFGQTPSDKCEKP
jgi:hypothetical protein